jgi:hypothetical protein
MTSGKNYNSLFGKGVFKKISTIFLAIMTLKQQIQPFFV